MPAPPVYLDQCMDVALAGRLAARGYTATTTYAQGRSGATDEDQLISATQRGWLLLSHNARDFKRWHRTFQRQGRSHGGILLLPRSPLRRLELRAAMALDWLVLRGQPAENTLTLWNDVQFWLNQRLVLPGFTASEAGEVTGRSAP